jgi:hypothetical protein
VTVTDDVDVITDAETAAALTDDDAVTSASTVSIVVVVVVVRIILHTIIFHFTSYSSISQLSYPQLCINK